MREDIRDIASILDEDIEKAEKKAKERMEKALSFDLTKLHEMGGDSPFYNPYRMAPEGGWLPYPPEFWITGNPGRTAEEYSDVTRFYKEIGCFDAWDKVGKSLNKLNNLAGEVESIVKALPPKPKMPGQGKPKNPIGTIHTYKDGVKYKKVAEGKWVPVVEGHMKNVMQDKPKAHLAIDEHAGAVQKLHKIAEEIKRRTVKQDERKDAVQDVLDKQKKGEHRQVRANEKELPHNNLGKKVEYTKAGKDVSLDDCDKFIGEFEKDFEYLAQIDTKLREITGVDAFSTRLKSKVSLFNKMRGRLSDRSLNTVTDAIGSRGLFKSLKKQKQSIEKIKGQLEVTEIEDFVGAPRPDGYRAVHMLFKTASGKMGELQLKTYRQQIFAGFSHDKIYKGKPEIKKSPEVNAWASEVSDYLFKLDQGGKDAPKDRPKEPQILRDNGISFPWDEMDEFGLEKTATLAGEDLKYYVVKRDPKTKENLEVQEFDTLKKAKQHQKQTFKQGFDGEMPIAYAKSEAEFFNVFSEYRTKDWQDRVEKAVEADIERKVSRRDGNGEQVPLQKYEISHLLQKGTFACISAGRNNADPKEAKLSDEDVQKRNNDLQEELIKKGYAYTRIKGKYGQTEDSFLVMVHKPERDDIIKLGEQFNQDSVTFSDKGQHELYYTTGANKGKRHIGTGHKLLDEKADDNYSLIEHPDGSKTKFAFNLDFNTMKSLLFKSLSDKRGIYQEMST